MRKTREKREDNDREKREKFDKGSILLGQLGRNLNNSFKPTYVVEFFFFKDENFSYLTVFAMLGTLKKFPNQMRVLISNEHV